MRHEFTVRIRIPRPTARLALLAGLLGWPALVRPVNQSATLVGYVPDGSSTPVSFVQLTANQKARLGTAANANVIMAPQDWGPAANQCAFKLADKPASTYLCTPGSTCGSLTTPGLNLGAIPTKCAAANIRWVQIWGNGSGMATGWNPSAAHSSPAMLGVDGDIWADRLCFWQGSASQCSTYWPMEFGQFNVCSKEGATSCNVAYNSTDSAKAVATIHWSVLGSTVPLPYYTSAPPAGQYPGTTFFPYQFTHKLKFTGSPALTWTIPLPTAKNTKAASTDANGYTTWTTGLPASVTSIKCKITYYDSTTTPQPLPPDQATGDCTIQFGDPGATPKTFPFSPTSTCHELYSVGSAGYSPCPGVTISG